MNRLRAFLFSLAAMLAGVPALAATIPLLTGPQDPAALQSTLNAVITSINANTPGYGSLPGPKNYLDNGAMFVKQRGTAAVTGASTLGCAVLSYTADRWCVDTNVTSGVGKGQVITATPSPPPGFQNSVKIWRDSGALTQPVEFMQEIETARATQLQAKPVIASCYVQPLAGYTGTAAISMNLFTGTGADQGLGALQGAVGMTASPAITPAWTGVAANPLAAGAGSPSWVIGTTAAWSRVYSAPFIVPAAATEAAFAIGFTPVGSSSGTTDGMAITGCQLEVADATQTAPSAFDFQLPGGDLARAQRYYWQISDPAATVEIDSSCFVTAANTTVKCGVYLPQQMWAAPVTFVTSVAFGIVVTAGTAGTCTGIAATASSNTVNSIGLTCTTGGTIALGSATPLIGAAVASAILNASSDY